MLAGLQLSIGLVPIWTESEGGLIDELQEVEEDGFGLGDFFVKVLY